MAPINITVKKNEISFLVEDNKIDIKNISNNFSSYLFVW